MQNLTTKTLKGIGWVSFAQIIKQVLQFIIFVVLARLLTPADFGLLGMIAVFTGFASLFSELGFGAALIQKQEVEDRHLSSIFWLNIIAGFLLMLIIAASAPLIAVFYDEPRLKPLTLLIAVDFFIGSFNVVQMAILNRDMNFRLLSFIQIVSLMSAGALAIVLALAGYGVWSLVWQTLFYTITVVVIMWMLTNWRPQCLFHKQAVQELLKFSSNLLGFNIFNYWIRNADNLLIGKFVGSSGLGIYSRAYSTMLLPLNQITRVLGKVMFPALSKIQDDKARVKHIYIRALSIIALVTFPMMLGLLVVSDAFVLALFGPKWVDMIIILRILCIVGLTQSIGSTVGWIYQSQGRTDWMFRWGIASGILTLIAFGIGINWGVIGVAVAYVIRTFMLIYFNYTIPGKLINMTFGNVVRSVTGIFGCAVAMALLVLGLGCVLPANWPHWAYLAVQVPFGMIVYLISVHLFKLKAYLDIRQLLYEQWRLKFAKGM